MTYLREDTSKLPGYYVYRRDRHPLSKRPVLEWFIPRGRGDYQALKKLYQQLQEIYPGNELSCMSVNEYHWVYYIHSGYWDNIV